MDDDGLVPDALAPGDRRHPGRREDDQVPLHDPELPQPGRRDAVGRAPGRDPRDLPRRRACWCSRTTPTACSASTPSRSGRCAPTRPRASSTSARSPRRSPRACGSAGRWRRTPCARSSCSPRSRRPCARRRSASWPCRRTSPSTTGRARSRSSARCTASAATRCSRRCDDLMPAACRVDRPARRLLRLAHAAGRPRRQGDAAARGHRAGRLRARHGVLRRRLRGAARMRLSFCYPTPGADPRGRPPAGRRDRGGARAARDLRRHRRRRTRPAAATTDQGRTSRDPTFRAPSRAPPRRRPGRRPVARARRLAALGPPRRRGAARGRARGGRARRRRRLLPALRRRRARLRAAPAARRERRGRRAARGPRPARRPVRRRGPAACRVAFDKPIAKRWSPSGPGSPRRPRSRCPHETFRELGAGRGHGRRRRPARAAAGGQAGARRLGPGLLAGRDGRRAAGRDGRLLRLRRRSR